MLTTEEKLYQSLIRLALSLSASNIAWTPEMREAFLFGFTLKQNTDFPYVFTWRCPYCDQVKQSPSDTGTDIICCGEQGHALLFLEPL